MKQIDVKLMHPSVQITKVISRIYKNGMTTTSGGNISILDENGLQKSAGDSIVGDKILISSLPNSSLTDISKDIKIGDTVYIWLCKHLI